MADEQDFSQNEEIKAKQQAELKELSMLRDQQQQGLPTVLGKRRSKDRQFLNEDQLEIDAVNRESMEILDQERIKRKVEKLRYI